MPATATAPVCPKCSGPMWDQKNGNFPYKPGTPIFKCKNKAECDGVIWEPRTPAANPKEGTAKRPYNTGPSLPGEFDDGEEAADLHAHTGRGTQSCEAPSKSALMLELHGECFKYAYNRLKKANEGSDPALIFTGSDVLSYAATLFIEANKKGIASLAA